MQTISTLEHIKTNFIVFGDSHSRCFRSYINKTHSFPASSAKGLGNPSSTSQIHMHIKNFCNIKYDGYIFYFGKVDMDWILTHILHIRPNTDFKLYIDDIICKYITFIKELCITNVYICELAISHLSDERLLKINNIGEGAHHKTLNTNLNDKYEPIQYTQVLPHAVRNEYIFYFNKQLKNQCEHNGYTLLEINHNFKTDSGEYVIPKHYLYENVLDHHLVEEVMGESYLKSIITSKT